jgi:aldehyde dehydrogenase (NAD+)
MTGCSLMALVGRRGRDAEDLPAIVRAAIRNAFHNSGQTRSALTRLIVPRQQLPEVERLAAAMVERMRVGDPTRDGTTLGPVVSKIQYERVLGYIHQGVAEGARLVIGGPERPAGAGDGYFVAPTVFSDVRSDMTIA